MINKRHAVPLPILRLLLSVCALVLVIVSTLLQNAYGVRKRVNSSTKSNAALKTSPFITVAWPWPVLKIMIALN